jgi:signal transduction histidine kinase
MKENASDSIGLPFSLNKIAFAHLLRNDAEEAIPYLDRAYGIRVRHKDNFGIIENLTFYGDYYRTIGQHQEAIRWYQLSNQGCDSLQYPYQKQYNLEQLSICFEQLAMYREALEAGREANLLSDSLLNEQNSRTIIELEKKYQLSEKNLEIAELDELAARRKLYIFGAIALLILVAGVFMYRLQIQRRKSQHEKDQAIIAEREAGLKAVFDATEEERKRIARDLHDGIGQRLSGLKMGWEALKSSLSDQQQSERDLLKRLTTVLDETATEVRTLSHQMMPRSLQ